MKAIILDGSLASDMQGERVRNVLIPQLKAAGYDTEHIVIRDRKIGNCAGDFFCWVRSPVCATLMTITAASPKPLYPAT